MLFDCLSFPYILARWFANWLAVVVFLCFVLSFWLLYVESCYKTSPHPMRDAPQIPQVSPICMETDPPPSPPSPPHHQSSNSQYLYIYTYIYILFSSFSWFIYIYILFSSFSWFIFIYIYVYIYICIHIQVYSPNQFSTKTIAHDILLVSLKSHFYKKVACKPSFLSNAVDLEGWLLIHRISATSPVFSNAYGKAFLLAWWAVGYFRRCQDGGSMSFI